MAKFRKKPVTVEAITFDELVAHGRANSEHVVDGMPWSFKYSGHPITHENDGCYLIPTLEGDMRMTRDDMLITGVNGEIYPCKLDIFAATYDRVEPLPDGYAPVKSSNIEAARFSDESNELFVRFKGGGEYRYEKVDRGLFEDFLLAPSAGKFFHAKIKGKFDCHKVE